MERRSPNCPWPLDRPLDEVDEVVPVPEPLWPLPSEDELCEAPVD